MTDPRDYEILLSFWSPEDVARGADWMLDEHAAELPAGRDHGTNVMVAREHLGYLAEDRWTTIMKVLIDDNYGGMVIIAAQNPLLMSCQLLVYFAEEYRNVGLTRLVGEKALMILSKTGFHEVVVYPSSRAARNVCERLDFSEAESVRPRMIRSLTTAEGQYVGSSREQGGWDGLRMG